MQIKNKKNLNFSKNAFETQKQTGPDMSCYFMQCNNTIINRT
jgi:hypothetical protein